MSENETVDATSPFSDPKSTTPKPTVTRRALEQEEEGTEPAREPKRRKDCPVDKSPETIMLVQQSTWLTEDVAEDVSFSFPLPVTAVAPELTPRFGSPNPAVTEAAAKATDPISAAE